MDEEMKKVDILCKMFHLLNLSQMETLWKMASAIVSYDEKKDQTDINPHNLK